MTSSATAAPAVRAAFTQLVDYAGLFPPAKLEMGPALAEYAVHEQGAFSWMLGRFIVPASRIAELRAQAPQDRAMELSAIVDGGADPRAWLANVQAVLASLAELRETHTRLRIGALEAALLPLMSARDTYDAAIGQLAAAVKQAGFGGLPLFVELPRDERFAGELPGALFALARHGLGAKIRCGGVVPQAFPPVDEVARFIGAAVREHRVPLKATAGLHHPIRHLDESLGVMMHGFLNILTAAVFARDGAGDAELERIISCEDPKQFTFDERGLSWDGHHADAEHLRSARAECFIGYGSCSFSEPVADLQALGML